MCIFRFFKCLFCFFSLKDVCLFDAPFSEKDEDVRVVSVLPTSESFSSLSHPTPPASRSSSPAQSQTSPAVWTSSSGSDRPDKPGSDGLSTVSQFWESSVSKQEGSTSLETGDPSTPENEGKNPTYLYSETNVATTESLEVLNASQLADAATAGSSYRIDLDSRTIQFVEASGQEPETVTANFGEDVEVYPTIGKIAEDANTTLEDEVTVSPVVEDENNVTSTLEIVSSLEENSILALNSTEDTTATPTVTHKEETVSPTIEGKPEILISLENETYVAPAHEEPYDKETTQAVLIFEEAPTTGREPNILPTVALNEEKTFDETYDNKNEIISSTEFEFAFTQAPELQDTPMPTFIQKEGDVLPTPQEDANNSLVLRESARIFPTPREGTNISLTLEEGAHISITLKEGTNISLASEEGSNISQMLKEATDISPNTNIYSATEKYHNMSPNHEGKAGVYPTYKDDRNMSPTNEGVANNYPTVDNDGIMSPTHKGDTDIYPTVDDRNPSLIHEGGTTTGIYSTVEESPNILPTLEGSTHISPTGEGAANTFPATEDDNVSSALEEEVDESSTNVDPTLDDSFSDFPVHSQKSTWALLTTTIGPQQHLNHLEYSRKTSPVTSTTPPGSSSPRIKPSAETSSKLTSTTHWSRGSWSPTTPTPKNGRPTTALQKVTPVIPPVDEGLVDVEFSLTQPPTLHLLPNERAVVGNTGRASGNVNASLIGLIILFLLTMH